MPSKKKKYNARFPPARIKKIMQSDEEVGKVAQAVPVIISRALELFVESLLKKAETVTQGRNAKTLTPSHLKQCIMAEQRFDFLKDLVSTVPDVQGEEDLLETPTPRSSASNQAFVYPNPGGPKVSTPPSSALGAAPPTPGTMSESQPVVADYAQDLPKPIAQQTSVIVTPQQQLGCVLNPPGVTSNPYIPSISGRNAGIGLYTHYPHHDVQQRSVNNPNGVSDSSQQHSLLYGDKNLSHQYHPQHGH